MAPATSLHPDDIVAKKSDLKALAVVERTTGDVDTHVPFPGRTEQEPINHDRSISHAAFRHFMKSGIPPKDTVLVRWRDEAGMELLPTSKVTLVDRSLLIGDIVKRQMNDAMSGCVLNTFTRCNLQPICDVTYQNSQIYKGILPPGNFDPAQDRFCIFPDGKAAELVDIPAAELTYAEALSEDDLVIFKDWIGRVEELTNAIRVRLSDNCVVEIDDEAGESVDGVVGTFFVGDLVKTKKGTLRLGKWIYGEYNPNTPPVGTVVSIRTIQADISWLEKRIGSVAAYEPPSVLEAAELESSDFRVYDRTNRPSDLDSAEQTISNSEPDVRLDMRVRFRDLTGACLKYSNSEHPIPKLDRNDTLGYDLNVFDITKFHTAVTVQWQDLTITTESSTDLVPDGSIDDEHAAWPGEIAHTLRLFDVPGVANVVQPERVGVVQSVNARDRMAQIKWSSASYVYYAKDPDEYGMGPIIEHRISNDSSTEEEISLYDVEAPAVMNVRRGDIALIAKADYNGMRERPADVTWLGEIVDTRLDGTLVVRLGAASRVRDVILTREEVVVAVRSDGTGQMDAWQQDEAEHDIATDTDDDFPFDEVYSETSWNSEDEMTEVAQYEDENGMILDEEDVENEDWESADDENDDENAEMHDAPEHHTPPTSHSTTPTDAQMSQCPSETPQRYEVLDSDVPLDHKWRHEPSSGLSAHMRRTQKEHKILRNPSTIPDGVFIRTWESRLDLLRILLIGPLETPYANAPFVIDMYLPPHFPTDPPQLYFHSWPAHSSIGALGRVNPNLYEDGKICLSLLGTWEGAKGESWNPAQSTLLQVIVSLLGLVLVREPYYNEAGYESLVGTEASRRSSALYSERVFLRAKGFIITALTSSDPAPGLGELEDIVAWLFRSPAGPKLLEAAMHEVESVLERSEKGEQEPDGLTVMSKGAAIPARRVLNSLQQLAAE